MEKFAPARCTEDTMGSGNSGGGCGETKKHVVTGGRSRRSIQVKSNEPWRRELRTVEERRDSRSLQPHTAVYGFIGMCMLLQSVLHPCRHRAGTQIRTEADTDGQRCTKPQGAPTAETASPSPGHHQGTSPNRDCEGMEEGVDG